MAPIGARKFVLLQHNRATRNIWTQITAKAASSARLDPARIRTGNVLLGGNWPVGKARHSIPVPRKENRCPSLLLFAGVGTMNIFVDPHGVYLGWMAPISKRKNVRTKHYHVIQNTGTKTTVQAVSWEVLDLVKTRMDRYLKVVLLTS